MAAAALSFAVIDTQFYMSGHFFFYKPLQVAALMVRGLEYWL